MLELLRSAAQLVKIDYEPLPPVLIRPRLRLAKIRRLFIRILAAILMSPGFSPRRVPISPTGEKCAKGISSADLPKPISFWRITILSRVTPIAQSRLTARSGHYDYSGRLTVYTASQSPFTQRHLFAQALEPLGLTHKDIRVISPYVGGGFGGKAGVSMEILAAALATAVRGNPVKILWSRSQEFYNTYQRQGLDARIKIGVKRDGTITALEQILHWDAGAYVEYGANVVNAAGLSATGPYRVPNVVIDSVCVYTNLPPGGPYRGFGYSEFLFGLESHINEVSKKLGIDPVEFRRKNAIRERRLPGLWG